MEGDTESPPTFSRRDEVPKREKQYIREEDWLSVSLMALRFLSMWRRWW